MENYIKGEVVYKVYSNPTTMYSVYKIEIEETDSEILSQYKTCSITGYFNELDLGLNYVFKGKVTSNPKYGFAFQAETYEKELPTNRMGLIQFFSSSSFRGIGKKTAEMLVDTLGLNIINDILENNKILDKVKGINENKKTAIIEGIMMNTEAEKILVTLYSYGLTPKMSLTLYDKYQADTLDVIKENPYRLIEDIEGIAFIKADKIALSFGYNLKSEKRIEACIRYCVYNYSIESGNTLINEDELIELVKGYLNFSDDEVEAIKSSIGQLVLKKKIVLDNNSYSDSVLYYSEKSIASKLYEMNNVEVKKYSIEEIDSVIKKLEEESNTFYEDDQKEAIYNAINNNVSIITGGPGTGKTTIEKGIIYVYQELINSDMEYIRLCAPTGKASKRIEESTTYKAQTIHKTLGCDLSGNFTYDMHYPLNIGLIVVDEASMIDTYLFKHLLDALNIDTRIVIVGDSDQLPSIGPGQVLKDLIDSNKFLVTKLTKIHRQKKNSKIISLAYDILSEDITTSLDPDHEELTYIDSPSDDLVNNIVNVINHFSGMGYSLESDIQVLVPIYKGSVGIDNLNKRLQLVFNPNARYTDSEETKIFIDDKVIQTVNQYEDSVMNGDMGVVVDSIDKELVVDYQGNLVKYSGATLSNIQLAYTISIHKSQGSEFKVVILPLYRSYGPMLNKRLLYTAVTRAKDYLVLIGERGIISRSMSILSKPRDTRLKDMIVSLE